MSLNGEDFGMIESMGGAILGEHLVEPEGGYARGPERALLSAVLFDGIQSFMNYAFASTKSAKSKYQEAYNWVMKSGNDYIFSFDNVCEALGVNSEFFRLGLINVYNSNRTEWKKKRRNF
jgi:hypothetical protein